MTPYPPDYGHTVRAETNRQRKAHALALAARRLGMQPYELTVVGGTAAHAANRLAVRRAAGLDRDPSVETWQTALGHLIGLAGSVPGVRQCLECGAFVLQYLTLGGRTVQVDPFPHELGTALLEDTSRGPIARIVSGADRPDDVPVYRQHVTSCPSNPSVVRRTAPRCFVCSKPMDPVLAARDASYTSHPWCDPREDAQPP